jgi:hypothetical protein
MTVPALLGLLAGCTRYGWLGWRSECVMRGQPCSCTATIMTPQASPRWLLDDNGSVRHVSHAPCCWIYLCDTPAAHIQAS